MKVICGRFEDVLPKFPAESVDLVFTSPPYGVGKEYEPDVRFGVLLQTLNSAFRECSRVLKRGGYAVFNFGNTASARSILETEEPCEMPMDWIYWSFGLGNGLMLQAQRIWQKDFAKVTNSRQAISAPRPVAEYEHLLTFRKEGGGAQVVLNRQISQRAIWSTVGEKSIKSKHPAAFPPSLVERVLEIYSRPGDVVLDPFAGGGTVGLVAQRMGRRSYLIEKEPKYVDDIIASYAAEFEGAPVDESPVPTAAGDEFLNLFRAHDEG